MKPGQVRQYIINAMFVPALLVLSSCDKSMELQEIAQCVAPVEGGDGLNAVAPRGLALIPEKQCYGLHWSIPLAFEPYLFGTPVENLNVTIGLLDQTPGAHMTDGRKAREQPQVSIYPQIGNEFEERIAEIRKAAEEKYGLQTTARSMYGMEVLSSDETAGGVGMVMFYPVNPDAEMVVCTTNTDQVNTDQANADQVNGGQITAGQIEAQIDPLTLCSVTTYMNEQLFAEYRILYSLMPQFELLNSVLVNSILEFRTSPSAG
jgi:hypothetical protein